MRLRRAGWAASAWDSAKSSYWFFPGAMAVGAAGLAWLAEEFRDEARRRLRVASERRRVDAAFAQVMS